MVIVYCAHSGSRSPSKPRLPGERGYSDVLAGSTAYWRAQNKLPPHQATVSSLTLKALKSHLKGRPAGNLLTLKQQPAVGLGVRSGERKLPTETTQLDSRPLLFRKEPF